MKYYCHAWAGAPIYYLKILDRLQKWIYRTVGTSIVASLKPQGHHQKVASLSLFYGYYFFKYLSELAQLVPHPYSCRFTFLLDWIIFMSPQIDVIRMSMSAVSFFVWLDTRIPCL